MSPSPRTRRPPSRSRIKSGDTLEVFGPSTGGTFSLQTTDKDISYVTFCAGGDTTTTTGTDTTTGTGTTTGKVTTTTGKVITTTGKDIETDVVKKVGFTKFEGVKKTVFFDVEKDIFFIIVEKEVVVFTDTAAAEQYASAAAAQYQYSASPSPAGGSTGCEGGTNNASHAIDNSNPSNDATRNNRSAVDAPAEGPLNNAPGYQQGENVGLNNASDTRLLSSPDNCRN
jgi:hypothetical protein